MRYAHVPRKDRPILHDLENTNGYFQVALNDGQVTHVYMYRCRKCEVILGDISGIYEELRDNEGSYLFNQGWDEFIYRFSQSRDALKPFHVIIPILAFIPLAKSLYLTYKNFLRVIVGDTENNIFKRGPNDVPTSEVQKNFLCTESYGTCNEDMTISKKLNKILEIKELHDS